MVMDLVDVEVVEAGRVAAPIAVLDNVTKKYGAITALDGLSLALRPG